MMRHAGLLLMFLLTPVNAVSAAEILPEAKRPDFSVSRDVITRLEAIISRLEAAEKNDPSSWQIGRALGNCKEVHRTIAQWPGVGAYDPRGAERLWKECKSTYDAAR